MKDRIIAEYALRHTDKPIGVAEYHITKKLSKALRGNCRHRSRLKKLLSGDG